jgi:hypothetical protein
MKTNYLKLLFSLILVTALITNAEAQRTRNGGGLFHVRNFPVIDTTHHFPLDTAAWVRDTTHHWKPDTTVWVRDTNHIRTPDTTHHWTPGTTGFVRDTTHHWTPDTTGFVRDTTHYWTPDTTGFVRDTTHHWTPDTTAWVKDSIHHWTPDSTHLNKKLMRVRSSIFPNPSLSGEASIIIDAATTETFTLNVYNTGGTLITTQSVTGGTTLISILTSGFYYYQVINSSGVKVSGGIIMVTQ